MPLLDAEVVQLPSHLVKSLRGARELVDIKARRGDEQQELLPLRKGDLELNRSVVKYKPKRMHPAHLVHAQPFEHHEHLHVFRGSKDSFWRR